MPGKARPHRSPALCGPQRSHLFSQNTTFLPMPPLALMLVRRLPTCLPFPYAHESAKDRMASHVPAGFHIGAPTLYMPASLPCSLSAPMLHVGAHASRTPMGNQSPCLKIPTLRIFSHPENPHREIHLCDMFWWTAARDGGRRKARPARRNGAGDGRRGIGGPAVGVPAMAGTKRCLPIWSAYWPTVYGRPIGRRCLAGTTRGPPVRPGNGPAGGIAAGCHRSRRMVCWPWLAVWCRARMEPAIAGTVPAWHGMWCPAERRHLSGIS